MDKKTKLLSRRAVGVFLIAFGLLSFFNIVSPSRLLATVIYPQYFWYHLYPDSTDVNNPTIVTAGSSITLDVEIVYQDGTAGVELPSPAYWVVTVTITRMSDNTVIQTINLGLPDLFLSSVAVDSHMCTVAVWQEPWRVPTGDGVVYSFAWSVQVKDAAGIDYGTQTKNTFAKTPLTESDGAFRVNGKDASQTSGLVVLNPALSLEFVPNKNADKITAVKVETWKGSLIATTTLTKQASGSYTGSYTLPGYGTYELRGMVEWTGGSPLRKMSLTVGWGEEDGGGWFGLNQIVGLVSMAIGIFLTVKRK